jgi:poly-beta-1,6-N-acetyl-D-glucosamine synthase
MAIYNSTTPEGRYVLITPARNEARFISETILSVISQSVKPYIWIIVSDGSTDATDSIARNYCAQHAFIRLIRNDKAGDRDFGSKSRAFAIGYKSIQQEDFAFVGNLDADITVDSGYYAKVIQRLRQSPTIGIAGGNVLELLNGRYVAQNISRDSVAGAIQLFRRDCFESIGGYIIHRGGGIDAAAEIMARMKGWEVRTYADLSVYHHRRVAWSHGGRLIASYRRGVLQRELGYNPLFQAASAINQLAASPPILWSISSLVGFWIGTIMRAQRVIPDEAVKYLRQEQLLKLRRILCLTRRK